MQFSKIFFSFVFLYALATKRLRLIAEKARRKGKKIFNCFVDFKKAFDSIDQT